MLKNILLSSLLFFCSILQNAYAVYPAPLQSQKGMIVSEHYLASKIGAQILAQGGNAVDAAVAVGYALAVLQPCCGNIGGGGFMLIHLPSQKNTFIIFREKSPLAASANMYLDSKGAVISGKSLEGFSAVGVPGTVMGLDLALRQYGTLSRETVMAPAIQLAKEGFTLTESEANILSTLQNKNNISPKVKSIFFSNGATLKAGQKLIQTDLAHTLELISKEGTDAFYKGLIAKEIVHAAHALGGYLTLEDFAKYTVQELKPIVCQYRAHTIITSPPPSSGGIALCEMLAILEGYDLRSLRYHSAQSVHYMIEAMRYAFADRNTQLGDPDFVQNPKDKLLSKSHIEKIRENIQTFRAGVSSELPLQETVTESTQTTHYSVADSAGNLVSVTYTLNGYFGAKVIAGNTGFFLNNQMDDFSVKAGAKNQFGLVEGVANSIASGKRPLSSMTPTIVFKGENPFLVLGSPGGPRIITSVLQTLINVIDYDMDIQMAVDAPRFHHQWMPDLVDMEKFTFSQDTLEKLAAMGYRFRNRGNWSVVEAILIDSKTKTYYGANDDRLPSGGALAPDK
jgi:gamma-glutamyltranspeptidase/glutathione hydrolase